MVAGPSRIRNPQNDVCARDLFGRDLDNERTPRTRRFERARHSIRKDRLRRARKLRVGRSVQDPHSKGL